MGNLKLLLALALASSLTAGTSSLGIVTSGSILKLNGATVPSNGTLFEGSTLEPGTSSARVQLADGSSILLSSGSKGRFFAGHMELEKGQINLISRTPYRVDVRSYRVSVAGQNSQQSIGVSGGTLQVNSVRGNANVKTAANVLLASVAPGRTLSFTDAAGQADRSRSEVTGMVRWNGGTATLEDETTHVQFRLTGADALAKGNLNSQYSGRVAAVGVASAYTDTTNTLALARVRLLAANAQTPGPSPQRVLSIVVEEGEGAINNVRERTAREAIVRVEDENHKPVAGAVVSFVMPNSGPGGAFANGSKVFETVTNSAGRAHALIQPNAVVGKFNVSVSATSNGATATAIVAEVNVAALAGVAAAAGAATGAATAGSAATASVAVVSGVVVAAAAGPIAAIVVGATAPAPPVSSGVVIP